MAKKPERKQKLKVFRTPIGFHDAYVAAPSQKAALEAWGADGNLFAQGIAEQVTDPDVMEEPLRQSRHGDQACSRKHRRAFRGPGPHSPEAEGEGESRGNREDPKPKAKPRPRPSREEFDAAEQHSKRPRRSSARSSPSWTRKSASWTANVGTCSASMRRSPTGSRRSATVRGRLTSGRWRNGDPARAQ